MSGHSRRFPLLDKLEEITNPDMVTALPSVTELIEQVDAGTSGGFSLSIAESQFLQQKVLLLVAWPRRSAKLLNSQGLWETRCHASAEKTQS